MRLCKGGVRVTSTKKCKSLSEDKKKAEWDKFVEAFSEELEDFLKDDDIKQTEYYTPGTYKFFTLGSKDVAEKYIDYAKKEYISNADDADCIRDYFMREALSSNKLSLSLLSLLLFFAILL